MKIYVVIIQYMCNAYHKYDKIIGIYSSQEKAKEKINKSPYPGYFYINCYELDK